MILFTTAESNHDLSGIHSLQKINLANVLSADEIASQGFVTVSHSIRDLKEMNEVERHIIAKENDRVVGYLLAMTKQSRWKFPVLFPMFEKFEQVDFLGKPVCNYRYIVVGQVCIAKEYRGQSVLDKCYEAYKEHFHKKFDFAITEIAASNLRSLKAHARIGFRELNEYSSPDGQFWKIVAWDWK